MDLLSMDKSTVMSFVTYLTHVFINLMLFLFSFCSANDFLTLRGYVICRNSFIQDKTELCCVVVHSLGSWLNFYLSG